MSNLTYCRLVSKKYVILNRHTIVKCLFWFGFLTGLLLLHLWLGFKIRDLKIQTQIAQRYRLRLIDYTKALRSEVYGLEKDSRLREIARRELKMRDTQPYELEYMRVPSSLLAKYKAIDVDTELAFREKDVSPSNTTVGLLQKTLLKLTRTSVAEQPDTR
ncbi:hypothetical protein J7M23_11115 [Candidatus Sumerlaeota bacterium]|nr:hypothetical protein [Candidatus Sumerlaeota bacterium]